MNPPNAFPPRNRHADGAGLTPPASRFQDRRGVAIVLVLSFLVLLTVLVVTFFSSVSTELSGATSYASEANSKQLSDSAVQLVMGAIKQATTSGSNIAWASQPGMIRTYGDGSGGASNAALADYKLYSSSQMVVSGTFSPAGEIDAQWNAKPALYTDLNAPVVAGGTMAFPIIDGNVIAMTVGGSNVYTYGSGSSAAVAGFYTNPPQSYVSGSAVSAANNPVPMPVKWIYVLRDGTLTVPSENSGTVADFKHSNNPPTKDNPITGRIAFWTDDECAKVNINTASEGVYMDTPRVGTAPEINLANNQPAQHEFYRYPGHPSMTSLSTVFGSWMPLPPGGTPANAYAGLTAANYAQYLKPYYDISPRVVNGPGGISAATATLIPDRDRLYASIDELMFTPSSSGGVRVPNKNGSGVAFTRQQIEQSKFFITANSRSPDVNLFSQPRVCVWPIHATNDSTHRTTLDNLIAFCSTQNGNPYYFQRSDPTSPLKDISLARNQDLLKYLRRLAGMPIPGFAASSSETFNAKYNVGGANDMDQIFTEIFDYIRSTNTCDSALPASGWFTKTVPGKPALASNEVVPSYDSTTDTKGFGRFLSPSQASFLFIATADGDWNAAHPAFFQTGTSAGPAFPAGYTDLNVGAGKIGMKAALLLDLYDVANGYPAMTSNTANYSFVVTGLASFGLNMPDAVTLYLGAAPYNYSRGYGGGYGPASLYIPIAGILKGASATAVPVSTSPLILDKAAGSYAFSGGTVKVAVHYKDASGLDNTIQTVNFQFPAGSFPLPKLVNSDLVYSGTDPSSSSYLSLSQTPWSVPAADGTSRPITSSTVTSRISPGDVLKGEPGKPFPWVVPLMPKGFQFLIGSTPTYPQLDFTKFGDRFDFNNNSLATTTPNLYSQTGAASGGVYGIYHGFSTITPYDTVRSIQSTSGDIRLSAGRKNVAAGDPVFSPHPYYNNAAQSLAHSQIHGDGTPLYGATRGVLAPGLQSPNSNMSPYFGQMTNWGAFWSTYTLYYAPSGKVGFPGYDGIPGAQANGPLNPGKLRTSVFNGVTCPNWGPIVTSTDGGGGMNQLSTIYTLEPQVRSIDGVAAGYAPPTPTTSFTDWQNAPSPKVPGDWDNGVANIKDGPYINKPDEGALTGIANQSPYFDWNQSANVATAAMFSPNRQIPSAVMFGSLPTGVKANKPWQTLLFRPDPGPGHKGAKSPQDHLLLDLFTMPVVEPYPISEPLSTAGRINMNYQIVPFTYINRDTGIRAVLKGERILAIPNASSGGGSTAVAGIKPYKTNYATDTAATNNSAGPKYMQYDLRFDINADETLKGFQARFDANDLFRSASEICTLDLIPNDSNYQTFLCTHKPAYSADGSAMRLYWSEHALTGDNSRERPYADIYPRLTTKSNTYTVHFRVQTLTKVKGSRPDQWTEGKDYIASEYRGSQTIERYVDPSDGRLQDYAAGTPPALDTLYKFRVLSSKRFAP